MRDWAVLGSGALVAGAIVAAGLMGRYDVETFGGLLYRVDRLTGVVEECQLRGMNGLNPDRPAWC